MNEEKGNYILLLFILVRYQLEIQKILFHHKEIIKEQPNQVRPIKPLLIFIIKFIDQIKYFIYKIKITSKLT